MALNHLRYPDLLDLLEVPDKSSGTLSIKTEYSEQVIVAKDRMLKHRNWKLVYQPLDTGVKLMLFDHITDPGCKKNLAETHRDLTEVLFDRLKKITQRDELIHHSETVITAVNEGDRHSEVLKNNSAESSTP